MCSKITCISDILPWKLWTSQTELHEVVWVGIFSHILPWHQQSSLQQSLYVVGEKSVFLRGVTEVDIKQLVCETLMFPTLEVT